MDTVRRRSDFVFDQEQGDENVLLKFECCHGSLCAYTGV
jgi:hypothetical protein